MSRLSMGDLSSSLQPRSAASESLRGAMGETYILHGVTEDMTAFDERLWFLIGMKRSKVPPFRAH